MTTPTPPTPTPPPSIEERALSAALQGRIFLATLPGKLLLWLLVIILIFGVGYCAGHRGCEVPQSVKQAHDSTVAAVRQETAINKPLLAADTALQQQLKVQNVALRTRLDSALSQLYAFARRPAVNSRTDSLTKSGGNLSSSAPNPSPLSPDPSQPPPSVPNVIAAIDTVKAALQRCDTLAETCRTFRSWAIQKFAADSNVSHAKDGEIAALRAAMAPSRFGFYADAGYNAADHAPFGQVDGQFVVTSRLSLIGSISVDQPDRALKASPVLYLSYRLR